MIIPCIDLMDGKVVQLIQGRAKALEGGPLPDMLRRFSDFPEIQVIDLNAAMGTGSNDRSIRLVTRQARTRVGGGVRSVERAKALIEAGAHKVIVGTAAFTAAGLNQPFLTDLAEAIGLRQVIVALDSLRGRIVVKGWRKATRFSAEEVLGALEPYCGGVLCTYVDKEGMLQGTNLDWFRRLRAATRLEITAAGGISTLDEVRALLAMNVNAALGMAVYTGRLSLVELARLCPESSGSPRG
jgi:phosphoribosylformimino-5-aminoimidazole carboxamide ribotide isomerase